LNTGAKMPVLGLGTWKSEPNQVGDAVKYALTEAGYQHIDCAPIYQNEPEVGAALQAVFKSGAVQREDIFVTSKLWNHMHARADVRTACETTLRDLQLDYLDLFLIHWGLTLQSGTGRTAEGHTALAPVSIRETWEAMEDLAKAGLVRAIGVANFTGPMIIDLLAYAKTKPAVNQIELHPYLQQTELIDFCRRNSITMTAYSPLGRPGEVRTGNGQPVLIDDPKIKAIADAHQKTPAQVLLRWGIQRGTIVIPKSTTPIRIKENINVFDFALSATELAAIASLDRKHRFVDAKWWDIAYFD